LVKVTDFCVILGLILYGERLNMGIRTGLWAAVVTIVSLSSTAAIAAPAANYIGGGVRTGFQDDTVFILNGKFKATDLGPNLSLSGRPTVMFGDEVELRLAVTGEGEVARNLSPFFGGGVSINTDGSGKAFPLLNAGLDYRLADQLVIQVGGNLLFKSGDTDTELTMSLDYAF
jgi:hypothetical protein